MESLFARAIEVSLIECRLPSGNTASLRRITMRFGRASPDRLPEGSLPSTYTSKPLVTFNGAAMFGELAVVRWLEVDGWKGAWLDTFHGRKVWNNMPTTSAPIALPVPQQQLYDRIVRANGGRASGMFDVMAWKDAQTIFVEYKGPGDRASRHQGAWIDAVLTAGLSQNDLYVVKAAE
jgi:hypothetical protein